ncbi:helix-turn-helix domain-containing protein [Tabrizicola sp. WMC-M-20]|nr:helix-turn-helix domain-containing protein [Tabrizicola sp. WMC-M-20]
MSRSYGSIRPRANWVYSVEEVMTLYNISRNTVSNWINTGLCPIDQKRPQLFRGAELARFHEDRRARSKRTLRPGEFKCLGCKAAVYPNIETLRLFALPQCKFSAWAECPDCGAKVIKLLAETECTMLKNCLATNTNPAPSDEANALVTACVGTSAKRAFAPPSVNDRTLYAWQAYAGKNDPKTIDAHLIAIRYLERFVGGKSFDRVTTFDAAAWREDVIRRTCRSAQDGGLSRSSARHRASYVRQFFAWLAKQPAHRHLAAVPDYVALPRKCKAGPELQSPKVYPTLDEALEMLNSLPSKTPKNRRDRAIFSIAFVTGLRKSALITLRLRHVDVERRRVHHDGRDLRAKNGKSFDIDWFPRTEPFQAIVLDWITEAGALGLYGDDAVFPAMNTLLGQSLASPARLSIAPMRGAGAVDEVFATASKGRRHYTPHSARHTLAALGDKLCRTPEQRKAWSLNLGHASEAVTWTHYGKVDDARKAVIFAKFGLDQTWTNEEMALMLSYHAYQLYPGTPEFTYAERLVERYRTAGRRVGDGLY